jgi:hypothetical protein
MSHFSALSFGVKEIVFTRYRTSDKTNAQKPASERRSNQWPHPHVRPVLWHVSPAQGHVPIAGSHVAQQPDSHVYVVVGIETHVNVDGSQHSDAEDSEEEEPQNAFPSVSVSHQPDAGQQTSPDTPMQVSSGQLDDDDCTPQIAFPSLSVSQ